MKASFDIFYLKTPLGCLKITTQDYFLVGVGFADHTIISAPSSDFQKDIAFQIAQYFCLKRKTFQIPMRLNGTSFQQKVWSVLKDIPWGTLTTYKKIAERVDCPKGYRAVGQTIHCNPIALIIPCHRVIGQNGHMTGYAFGVDRKRYLIDLEQSAR